ncbi:MAG: bifunctional pyr operon transcriptional regulator/uracil phosphoribosyltransferase PyrR [Lentisphaerae bacterium]|nr:bifunctional pyr operon transcriptional regulator/uracil phosphoribosyltransferase PyrR [Lentisphaerota bacterium]MCP4100046.1 bifunctional pyr operon transcriptional regulator/uracil phosphoribosyltransferase PyrR [Lentisphaerota bacterium]
MPAKREVCNGSEVQAAITRVADAIISEFLSDNPREFAMIGIHRQGVPMAERIIAKLESRTGYRPQLALLDISMYRDDIGMRKSLPIIHATTIPFDMNDTAVILVDDVLSSGRTIRAALDAVTDYGRPELIRLAVLIDRGNREFPIRADYVGMKVDVSDDRKLAVEFNENNGQDGVYEIDWKKYRRGDH